MNGQGHDAEADSLNHEADQEDFEGLRRPNNHAHSGGYGAGRSDSGQQKFRNEVLAKRLPYEATESDIESFFTQFGKVASVNLQRNQDRTSRGLCFIRFDDERSMNNAIEKNGIKLMDRPIHIEKTKPRSEREGSFGAPDRFGGRGGRDDDRRRDSFRRDDREDFRGYDRRGGDRDQRDRGRDRSTSRERSRDQERGTSGPGWHKNQTRTVFVGNLNFSTSEGSLRDFFEDCGSIKDVRVTTKPDGRVGLL